MKILLIEDEARIAASIKEGLEQESYAVDVCLNGEAGYNTARAGTYDVILLDVMLPIVSGIEVCKRLRTGGIQTPILMLTAMDQTKDIVAGLNSGADDYLAKPFAFDVLLARIRVLLRRHGETASDILTVGDLTLDTARFVVKRGDVPIYLSRKEYSILEYLMRHQGTILSKNNIMSHVWDFDADILPNTLEVFIAYLRNKVDKPFDGSGLIQTVRGFGYKIEA